jgi:predicted ribosomally synthesized peptide with SipW-like signal peptide
MTDDDTTGLSRRRLLGSVATIGGAAALGGAGSMAFFSDTETYANNRLVAGELDLKVDFEEHYVDWIGSEAEFARMPEEGEEADYFLPGFDVATGSEAFPIDGEMLPGASIAPLSDSQPIELVWTQGETAEEGQDLFWDASSIEAYPDADNDGIQDQEEGEPVFPDGQSICETDSDTPALLSSDLRTSGTVKGQTTEPGDPVISLEDVKPGDFGEVTLSFHLCDNPGYVSLFGDLRSAAENGINEAEGADPDEDGDADSTDPEDVELLDTVLTRVWRDDGDNQVDQITGELDVVCLIDISGSLDDDELDSLQAGINEFITALDDSEADAQVGTLEFGDVIQNVNTLQDPSTLSVDVADQDSSRDTPLAPALDIGDQLVNDGPNARDEATKVVVPFTDGGPNYENTSYSGGGFTAPRDDSTAGVWTLDGDNDGDYDGGTANSAVDTSELQETADVADAVRMDGTQIFTVNVGEDPDQALGGGAANQFGNLSQYLANFIADNPGQAIDVGVGDLSDLADQLVELVTVSEEVLFFGTLRQALDVLSQPAGLPLNGDIPAEEGGGASEINCFEASTTQYIGFEWWLPLNHGNQIQSDSVSFDLGFYTEQCRHNDGISNVRRTDGGVDDGNDNDDDNDN